MLIADLINDLKERTLAGSRALVVIAVVGVASTISLTIALTVRETTRPPEQDSCITNSCIDAAARIRAWMNKTEAPCNDFFNFACGNWIDKHAMPPGKSYFSTVSGMGDELLLNVKRIVESQKMTDDNKTNKLITDMRKFYCVCLQRDKYGSASDRLTKLFKLFPMPHVNPAGWAEKSKNFDAYLAELTYAHIYLLMTNYVDNDVRNTTRLMLNVDQAFLSLRSRRVYLEKRHENIRKAYVRFVDRTLKQVYADLNITGVKVDAQGLVDFETSIANATTPPEQRRDINRTDNRWTFAQLKEANKMFNWGAYIDFLFAKLPASQKLANDSIIRVRAPEYLPKLDEILKNTPKRKIGELLTFFLVSYFSADLPRVYREIAADFREAISGTRGDDTRWKHCVYLLKEAFFNNIIARMYSEQYFDKRSKTEANEMISYVRNAFYTLLRVNSWMDEETRDIAAAKARKIVQNIGYPEYVYNGSYLEEKYGEIFRAITGNTQHWFEDSVKMRIIKDTNRKKLLWKTETRDMWKDSSVVVNAFYSPSHNQIFFPMGILRAPFFDRDYPKYLNYGGIGAVIGHEITHGFDDGGRQRDGDGNFRPWWPASTVTAFKAAAQCIIDQYGRYKAPIKIQNMTLNGVQTQGENIADNGGVKQAFEGYKAWILEKGSREKKLPGLPYTPEQLFFINYAQIWCSKMTEQEWMQRILSGVHAPTMFRVIGTLSNTPYFQEAFQCKAGDRMNPTNKCSVW